MNPSSTAPVLKKQSRLRDYVQLVKPRLSLLVVFSSAMAYLWATDRNVDSTTVWLLSTGGFLVTASANILNQVIEKDSDKLMKRTSERPLASGRMKVTEALMLSLCLGAGGVILLAGINLFAAAIGVLALLIYAGMYTPLKKITAWTVVPGAVAGSLPVVIGWVAARNEIGEEALLLFSIQFIWQFPHTWSIAWLLNDEYNKAGLKMLPGSDRTNTSALLIMLSTFLMIPSAFLLYMYESAGVHVTWIIAIAGIILLLFALQLYCKRNTRSAVAFMLCCFIYLPLVLIALVAEKYL
ncbi:MAG: heme o synthase [Bacteroidota bacterium]